MKDPLLEKTPPHDKETEQAVLSALFINNAGFDDIDGLEPADFYTSAHSIIFQSMLDLRKKGQAVDLVTVAQNLTAKNKIEKIGGASYLAVIADSAPIATNVHDYSETIKNLAAVRNMLYTSMRIASLAHTVTDVEDYISQAQAEILKIQTTTSVDRIYSMSDLMVQTIERIEDAQSRSVDIGLSFGFPTLDPLIQVMGSKLLIVAGRPGMGKTALALSIARRLAERGTKTGFLSIEMDKEGLCDRLLGHAANINPLLFYSRDSLQAKSMSNLNKMAGYLSELPLFIDDADCKAQDVERKCRKMKKMGCEIIFIDQLSKIRGRPGQSKFEQYSDNCSAIALIKKELRIPIVLLCQLNRNVEQRADKKPELSDLKQTGMIEEDADMVFLIYRPGYYDERVDQAVTDIILAKNRQGARAVEQQVFFNAKRMMFELSA
jgi:replicative DNA helicase